MSQSYVAWSKHLFSTIKEGGTWAVPRSGLIFKKSSGSFILTNRMPWESGMSVGFKEFDNYQKEDYRLIAKHMKEAGIPVTDDTGLDIV
jgi:hypothetical protein